LHDDPAMDHLVHALRAGLVRPRPSARRASPLGHWRFEINQGAAQSRAGIVRAEAEGRL
jgi:hypothetical protein